MGHEAKLQIVPIDYPLVREWFEASSDPGDRIQQMFFRFGEMRRGMNPEPFFALDDEEYRAYQRRIIAMAKEFPWLIAGFIDLDRGYDYVIYMLERWSASSREVELAHAAVLGFRQVAGLATASQGRSINWISPDEAAEICDFLYRLSKRDSLPELAINTIPADRPMYKRHSDSQPVDPAQLIAAENSIKSYFHPLLKFYQAARQNRFGVIAVRD